MQKIWSVVATEDDCVLLTLAVGPPQPLVAAITETELKSLIEPLQPVDEAVRRNAFSRSQLARICRDTIGRDPFEDETTTRKRERRAKLGTELAAVTGGVIGATANHDGWVRLLAGAVAAFGLFQLAQRAWQWRRSRWT